MKLIVHPHKIEIEKTLVNEKELNITKVQFVFEEEMQDFVKEAYFTLKNNTYKVILENDECNIPYEVLEEKGQLEIGVVAFKIENDTEIRYNPSPVYINTLSGSLKNAVNSEEYTPTDKEQIEQMLDNINIDANKQGIITTITITNKDGTTKTVTLEDGKSIEYNWQGTRLGIKREDESNYQYVDLKGDKGEPGAIKIVIVNELPSVGDDDTIYLVPYQEAETGNIYKEFIYINNTWEELGSIPVEVDLSDYYTKSEVNNLIPTQLSELTDDSTHRLTTDTEKTTWNNKSDFSGNYNDLSNKPDLSVYQLKSNLVTSISSSSTDTQYPSAKCVYDIIGNINSTLDAINGESI